MRFLNLKICLRVLMGLLLVVTFFGFSKVGLAQTPIRSSSFGVSPTKLEIRLASGETLIRNIYITNNLGFDTDFSITVEDVAGGASDKNEIISYYGKGLGPYSIKNYMMVGSDHIRVAQGETKIVPVMISLPSTAKPGGLYGGVFVSPVIAAKSGSANVSARIGTLVFLRVKGEVKEQGTVEQFNVVAGRKIFWTNSPVDFQVSFQNTGNIYLNPYGYIEIKDWKGKLVDRLVIDPWFVFPDSLRSRIVAWEKPPLFGYFTASLILNHGYTLPHISSLNFSFLIIPLPILGGLLILVCVCILAYRIIPKLKKWQI